jgi:glycosyltransferase involved in cell wall biosynthesis
MKSGHPKILHVITRMDQGGSAQNTLLSASGLAEKYDTVLAYGPTTESDMSPMEARATEEKLEEARARGVRTVILPRLYRSIRPKGDARCLWDMVALFLRERPALVHTHTSKAGLWGRVAARSARVPAIVHTPHGHVFHGHFSPRASRLFLAIERLSTPLCHHLVALTKGERDDMLRLRVCGPDKVSVIHSGVDTERFQNPGVSKAEARRALGLPKDALAVGYAGWLTPVKSPETLLSAMGRLMTGRDNLWLVMAGDGPLRGALEALARELGIADRVLFLGWRSDMPQVMAALDVFALPSLNEGMGRVVAEAMAAGLPVAASRTGGVPDLVGDGETGYLAPPGDALGLAAALARLLEDPEARLAMGARAREKSADYGTGSMLARLDALYSRLLFEIPENAGR